MDGQVVYSTHLKRVKCVARRDRNKYLLVGADIAALITACLIGVVTRNWYHEAPLLRMLPSQAYQSFDMRLVIYGILCMGMLCWFWGAGHYTRRTPFWDELRQTLIIILAVAVIDAAVLFLAKLDYSRLWWATTWSLAMVLVPVLRVQVKHALMRQGRWQQRTVIIGTRENAREAAAALRSEPLLGFEVVAFLAPERRKTERAGVVPEYVEVQGRRIRVLRILGDPDELLAELGHPVVVVALELGGVQAHQDLIQRLNLCYPDLIIVPALRGLPLFGMEVSHFFSHEVLLLRIRNNLERRTARFVKRMSDIIGASLLMLLLAPMFVLFAWQIRKSGGSSFYGHKRVGQHGFPFRCYKFRSMVPNADQLLAELLARDPSARAEWDRDFKLKNDPRITPIGAFLRKTSLDELPQLWNVLRGEMSLVGPRPIVSAELGRYGQQVDYYLRCRPGMTGLWQISGRSDTDYANRVYLDSWYVKNWSLWYDIVILIKTFKVVLAKRGAY